MKPEIKTSEEIRALISFTNISYNSENKGKRWVSCESVLQILDNTHPEDVTQVLRNQLKGGSE